MCVIKTHDLASVGSKGRRFFLGHIILRERFRFFFLSRTVPGLCPVLPQIELWRKLGTCFGLFSVKWNFFFYCFQDKYHEKWWLVAGFSVYLGRKFLTPDAFSEKNKKFMKISWNWTFPRTKLIWQLLFTSRIQITISIPVTRDRFIDLSWNRSIPVWKKVPPGKFTSKFPTFQASSIHHSRIQSRTLKATFVAASWPVISQTQPEKKS